ncbi:SH3 domain-containing protein [Candidatus Thiosymbion oneisti]|uniref:SH3 domain-containing protein n=1 Tax=Candidatus Thiosymbion oneisti TaxID=589554 RepID=UPI000B7F2889|nr:SH3 domain-containing protein [Candidatus Thiosymbion oneisti]
MKRLILVAALVALTMPAYAARDGWVTVDNLNRRTCPASTCGIVGVLKFREKATILEEKAGWARITKYYDASCVNGLSHYVDSSNKKCVSSNGINNGKFAEWVSAKYLSSTRPPDPAATASANYALVKGSDDFRIYKDAFAIVADQLIASGKCSANDFREMGGWMKSSNHRSKPIYFTYCGGMRSSNKIYLNAATGEIMR